MKTLTLHRIVFVVLLLNLALAATADVAFAAQRVNDDAITDQVRIKLASDEIVKGGALTVDCKEGVVTLSGYVLNEKQKDRAARLAKKVKGVKQVVNNLTVRSR
jgi:hyperosmotically inducible periplasmic protein